MRKPRFPHLFCFKFICVMKIVIIFIGLLLFLNLNSISQIRQGAYIPPPNTNTLVSGTALNITKQIFRQRDISSFDNGENIRGTKFMFENFEEGEMYLDTGKVIGKFLFNYDKTTQVFAFTQDNINYFVPNDEKLKYVIVKNNSKNIIFEKISSISKDFFLIQILKSENKFSLYKSVKANFKKARRENNGLVENNDTVSEFIDEETFFICNIKLGKYLQLPIKLKELKMEIEKIKPNNDFFNDADSRMDFDELSYILLVNKLNK